MQDERGFTLIEMLIASMVVVMVVGVIGTGLVVVFRTTEETTQRLAESPDLQIAAAYFGSDVQSAQTFSGSCGPASPAPLVTLSWTDPGTDPAAGVGDTTRVVTYVATTVGNQKELVRYSCIDGGTPASSTLVNYIQPTTSPTVACDPDCTSPATMSISMAICTADSSNACEDAPLSFELKATRRMT